MLVDSSSNVFRERYKKEMEARQSAISQTFRSNGIDEIPVSTETDYVEPLVKFFKKRERVAR